MKSTLFALILTLTPFAFAETNTELAGDCKPAVEQAISEISGESAATVESVFEINGDKVLVSYMLESEESMITGEAEIVLKNVIEVPRNRKNFLIKCDVVSATIIDERAD